MSASNDIAETTLYDKPSAIHVVASSSARPVASVQQPSHEEHDPNSDTTLYDGQPDADASSSLHAQPNGGKQYSAARTLPLPPLSVIHKRPGRPKGSLDKQPRKPRGPPPFLASSSNIILPAKRVNNASETSSNGRKKRKTTDSLTPSLRSPSTSESVATLPDSVPLPVVTKGTGALPPLPPLSFMSQPVQPSSLPLLPPLPAPPVAAQSHVKRSIRAPDGSPLFEFGFPAGQSRQLPNTQVAVLPTSAERHPDAAEQPSYTNAISADETVPDDDRSSRDGGVHEDNDNDEEAEESDDSEVAQMLLHTTQVSPAQPQGRSASIASTSNAPTEQAGDHGANSSARVTAPTTGSTYSSADDFHNHVSQWAEQEGHRVYKLGGQGKCTCRVICRNWKKPE